MSGFSRAGLVVFGILLASPFAKGGSDAVTLSIDQSGAVSIEGKKLDALESAKSLIDQLAEAQGSEPVQLHDEKYEYYLFSRLGVAVYRKHQAENNLALVLAMQPVAELGGIYFGGTIRIHEAILPKRASGLFHLGDLKKIIKERASHFDESRFGLSCTFSTWTDFHVDAGKDDVVRSIAVMVSLKKGRELRQWHIDSLKDEESNDQTKPTSGSR